MTLKGGVFSGVQWNSAYSAVRGIESLRPLMGADSAEG